MQDLADILRSGGCISVVAPTPHAGKQLAIGMRDLLGAVIMTSGARSAQELGGVVCSVDNVAHLGDEIVILHNAEYLDVQAKMAILERRITFMAISSVELDDQGLFSASPLVIP